MSLENIIVNIRRESDDLRPQLGATAFFHIFQNEITPGDYAIVKTRSPGSSFILAHGSWGRLGTVADGSQPYLGDSRGDWTWWRVISESGSNFTEWFLGSTFMSGNTTANWAQDGSITGAGSALSNPIYLGSREISSATMTVSGTGGPYYLAADGETWEAVTSATEHTFSTTGSDLRWKANIQDGSVIHKVEVDY